MYLKITKRSYVFSSQNLCEVMYMLILPIIPWWSWNKFCRMKKISEPQTLFYLMSLQFKGWSLEWPRQPYLIESFSLSMLFPSCQHCTPQGLTYCCAKHHFCCQQCTREWSLTQGNCTVQWCTPDWLCALVSWDTFPLSAPKWDKNAFP